MANCGNCSVELKFGNTPILGGVKLASGETICLDCFRKLLKINKFANSKKHTLEELKAKLLNATETINGIQEQLQNIGITQSSILWGRKEIAELPTIIPEDEQIFGLVQGKYNGGQGILVATNKRLLFVDKGLFYGLKVEDFGLDKISSIQYETGIFYTDIKIIASGNIAKISNVENSSGREFCEKVRVKLSVPKEMSAPITVVQQVDIAD